MSQPRIKRPVVVAQPDGSLTTPDTRHHYIEKLLALHESGGLPTVGAIELTVKHDDWCGVFRGAHCDCDPVIAPSTGATP